MTSTDDGKLADYLRELVHFRNNERMRREHSILNGSLSDYQERTDDIYELACKLGEESPDEQDAIGQMTLDEAIEHAKDVVAITGRQCGNKAFHCSMEHLQLADWLQELKDLKNRYAYLAADFDNYKKRVAKNEQYVSDKAYENVIIRFLSVYDDMKRLFDNIDFMSDEPTTMIAEEHNAYSMIFEKLENTLKGIGCEKIECKCGDRFDVNLMEAISIRNIEDCEHYESDDVVEIYQTGWKYKDKIIRPVKVVVGK